MNPRPIHLRPLIGVFVNKKFLHNSNLTHFAGKLYQANEKAKCSIYFFSPGNVNWKSKTINGYVLEGSRQWQARRLPFPDICYDRGTGFGDGERTAVEELRSRFKKLPGIQFINSCKLKKWQVHQKLIGYRPVDKFLPETTFSHGIDSIKEAAEKYGFLFLKSSGGSGGKGVFALEKRNHRFCFRYYHKGTHLKRYGANLDGLLTEMKTIGLKPDRVILQQGIRLVKYTNRPMDLRILMVKDKDGIWNAVYNQARVAQKGAVITNTSLGGEVMNYSDIYPALKKRYPGIPSDNKIKDICMVIARYIEKEFGSFGEIGIDIAVDKTGKVWLLEANSKPSKLPEQKIEDTVGISPQFLLTLEYAKLLFSQKNRSRNKADVSPSVQETK